MAIILFEELVQRMRFYPLSFTQPIAATQLGILSLKEWWEKLTGEEVFLLTEDYLQPAYPLPKNELVYFVNATLLPNKNIWNDIQNLQEDEALKHLQNQVLAGKTFFNKNEKMGFFTF